MEGRMKPYSFMGCHLMTTAEIAALHVNLVRMLAAWDEAASRRLLEGQPWWSTR